MKSERLLVCAFLLVILCTSLCTATDLDALCKCSGNQHCVNGQCQTVDCTDFTLLNSTVEQPAVVHASFRLTNCKGSGITHLDVKDLIAAEDGRPLYESTLQLTSAGVSAELHIVILLDLSFSIQDLGHLKQMQGVVKLILDNVPFDRHEVRHKVAIFGFAGAAKITPLSDFESDRDTLIKAMSERMGNSKHIEDKDSTSLYTAVQAVDTFLTDSLILAPPTHRAGVVVIISDGADTARRASLQQAQAVVGASNHSFVSVPIGKEIDVPSLRGVSPHGLFYPQSNISLLSTFLREHTQKLILRLGNEYDLLLCSARRKGLSTLTVQLAGVRGEGAKPLVIHYNATGFRSGCINRQIVGTCVDRCGYVNGRFCGHCALEPGNHTLEISSQKDAVIKSPHAQPFGVLVHSAPNGTLISWRINNRIPNDYFFDISTNDTRFRRFPPSPQGYYYFRFSCPTCSNETETLRYEIVTDPEMLKYLSDPPKPKPVVSVLMVNNGSTTPIKFDDEDGSEGSSLFWNIVAAIPILYFIITCCVFPTRDQPQQQPQQEPKPADPAPAPKNPLIRAPSAPVVVAPKPLAAPPSVAAPPLPNPVAVGAPQDLDIDDFFSGPPANEPKELPSYGAPKVLPPGVPSYGPPPPMLPKMPLSLPPTGQPRFGSGIPLDLMPKTEKPTTTPKIENPFPSFRHEDDPLDDPFGEDFD